MGGGYISCGEFRGEDKSGSALSGVLREIPKILSEQEAVAFRKLASSLSKGVKGNPQELRERPIPTLRRVWWQRRI
jgi:hypothetical protein